MKQIVAVFLVVGFLSEASLTSLQAGRVTAEVTVIGRIFNKPTRQHLQANFRGRGTHRPSGQTGSVNGGASSLPGERVPTGLSVLGAYRVNVRANVRTGSGSTSASRVVTVQVRRSRIIINGFGRINLQSPIRPTKSGRQNIRGTGNISIRTPF